MIKGKKLVALCTYRIYDPQEFAFITELNRLFRENNCALFIYALNSEIGNSGTDVAESAVFDIIPYDKVDAVVIMDEKIKSREIVQDMVDKATANDVPVLVIDGNYDNVSTICFDYAKGFENVVRHMIEYHKVKRPHMMAGKRDNVFSDERIEIFKKVIAENGIEFEDHMLSYGDFWAGPARVAAAQLLDRDKLPDGVICANDIMALNVCDVFQAAGVKVPRDVMVSGFDGLEESFISKPGITTANCDGISLGREVMKVLSRIFGGERNINTKIVPDFIANESCGCPRNTTVSHDGISALNNNFYHHQDDIHILQEITYKVMNDKNVGDQLRFLKKTLARNVIVVVEESCFDLENNFFFEDVEKGAKIILYDAYVRNENPHPYDPKEIVPHLDEFLKKGYPVVFNGLEYMTKCPGFVCYSFPGINLIDYTQTPSLTNSFGMGIGGYITNKYQSYLREKIQKMYETDALTGLYTRLAFIAKLEEIINDPDNYGKIVNIIVSDLNDLKQINDSRGHLKGDEAIAATAHALRAACPEGALCVRAGGDEMMAFFFGEYAFEKIVRELDSQLENASRELGFKVSSSSGMRSSIFSRDFELDKLIALADEQMYEVKRQYKEKN